LADRVDRLANGLIRLGTRQGSRIGVLLPNCHRFAELYLAAFQIGAVLVPLNIRLSPGELGRLLEHSEALGLVSGEPFREALHSMGDSLTHLNFRLGYGLEEAGFLDYEALIEGSPSSERKLEFDEGEVAVQMYTSGTTGTPKGVLLSHRNIMANTLTGIFERRFTGGDVFLNASPLYHIADFEYFMQILSVGGTNVFLPRFEPELFLETLERMRVTCTWVVPAMIHDLLAVPGLERFKRSSLRTLYYGGACLSPERFRQAQEVFPCEFSLGFGLTEASPLISLLRPEDHRGPSADLEKRLRSCGREAFNVKLRIVDDHDQEVTPGHPGEIIVQGANVMKGYWKNEPETRIALRGGWLHTGDMGRMDEDGYLYLVDRKKDVIKSGGENIFSREVEEAIASHPAVKEVAVIGIPDERWGEAVKAVIVPNQGAVCSEKEIREHCQKNLPGFKRPKSVSFVEALPKNITGKIMKTALREQYGKARGDAHGI
jgi:acyl-CoA synthetase (AMP-forming)/AMP-acid ligase II